jgi:hypothetical protein
MQIPRKKRKINLNSDEDTSPDLKALSELFKKRQTNRRFTCTFK